MTSRARAVVLAAFVLTTAWSWGVGASDDGVLRVAVLPAGLPPGQSPSSSRTAAPPAPTFRHTFGAERRQPEQARAIAADTTGLGADIVLLHGVGDVAGVRQLLPAASWNLVLSRQLAVRVEGRATATTAVAIRLSEVFRAVRQEHFLPPRDDETPASTAVLLRRGDAQVWLVALGSVPKPTDPIVGWLRERTREGAAVVIGGPATGEAIANLLGEGGAAPSRSIDGRPAPTRNGTKPTSMVTKSSTVSATAPRAACGLDIAITATGQSLAASKSAFLVPTQGSGDAPPRCGLTLDLLPGARAP